MLSAKESTGTLGVLNAAVTVDVRGNDHITVAIASGLTGTAAFEASMDGTTWYPVAVYATNVTTGLGTTITTVVNPAGALYVCPTLFAMAFKWFRVRCSAYTSGSASAAVYLGCASGAAARG